MSFTAITLRNPHIEVVVAPELGMRVLNAIDLKTGRSLGGSPDPRKYETDPFEEPHLDRRIPGTFLSLF